MTSPFTASATDAGQSFLAALRRPGPLLSVELRPPRSDLDPGHSMSLWIDMYHAVQRFVRQGRIVFLTDDAVGASEEESLAHLAANLGATNLDTVVPFLTCKHSLDYCRLFARRAASLFVAGITVVGGDNSLGPPRCLPHGQDLRRLLRKDQPDLPLGGWANPHRDPVEQARFVADADFEADFVLTQIVSHHSLRQVESFHAELARLGVTIPVVHGVFFYRSANPKTLARLGSFFPVPARRITADFATGASPAKICTRSIRALRDAGADKVYLSNLSSRDAVSALRHFEEDAEVGGND